MISPKELWSLVKESVNAWLEDRAASMGAALAYYTAFSIAPVLIIAIAVAGLVFGRDAAQASVVAQLQGLLGDAGGTAVEDLLKSTADFGSSLFAMVIGVSPWWSEQRPPLWNCRMISTGSGRLSLGRGAVSGT
jgi:membrane protein